jgi:hypothetical protein
LRFGGFDICFGEDLRGGRADFYGWMLQEVELIREEFRSFGGIFAGEMAEGPEAVELGKKICFGFRNVRAEILVDGGRDAGSASGEGELRFLADAAIGMGEKTEKFLRIAGVHSLPEQTARFGDDFVRPGCGMADAVDASSAGFGPALNPIGVIERTVGTEFDVGGQGFPEELFVRIEFEGGAFWFERKAVDAAAGAAAKITEEKVAAIFFGQAGAGIIREAGGAVAEIRDGRDDVGGLAFELRIPEFLGVPRAASGRLHVLVTDVPTAVAALNEVHPAGAIAAVGIVVAGEKISEVIEGEFLRIAQAAREHFEICAVGFAAEDCAFVGIEENAALFVGHVEAAIADGKVEATVGAHDEAVHVVAEERNVHAVAGAERLAFVRFAVVVGVFELPEVRDASEEHLSIAHEHAGGNAVRNAIEIGREDGGGLGFAVAVFILHEAEDFGFFGELDDVRPELLHEHLGAFGDAAEGEVIVEPIEMAADIKDAFVITESGTDSGMAMRFRHVEVAEVIDSEGDGVLQERFGGEEFGFETGREAELVDDFDWIADGLGSGGAEVGRLERSNESDGEDGEHGANDSGPVEMREREVAQSTQREKASSAQRRFWEKCGKAKFGEIGEMARDSRVLSREGEIP